MTYATPTHAKESWACPVARTFATPQVLCRGDACPAWRWKQIVVTDPRFKDAFDRAASDLGLGKTHVGRITKHLFDHRDEYGLPTRPEVGWCGLAGKPEA